MGVAPKDVPVQSRKADAGDELAKKEIASDKAVHDMFGAAASLVSKTATVSRPDDMLSDDEVSEAAQDITRGTPEDMLPMSKEDEELARLASHVSDKPQKKLDLPVGEAAEEMDEALMEKYGQTKPTREIGDVGKHSHSDIDLSGEDDEEEDSFDDEEGDDNSHFDEAGGREDREDESSSFGFLQRRSRRH